MDVRPFKERDLHGLLTLYRAVFGRERSEQDFRWKLLQQDCPVDTVWVAEVDSEIVGQHAGIPTRLKLGGNIVVGINAVEAMTDARYRKEGMFTELGGGLYNHWRERGIPLIMGLPHKGWGTRAYALGYHPAFFVGWL